MGKQYKYLRTEDQPEVCSPDTIYLIGSFGNEHTIAMICPCGCGSEFLLNMLTDSKPCWSFTIAGDKITIKPSINAVHHPCKSHFHITNGEVT